MILHGEYAGTVQEKFPWGLLVRLEGGSDVLVDRTKVGDVPLQRGIAVTVVVLDDSRVPVRGSLLLADREIARGLRSSRPGE